MRTRLVGALAILAALAPAHSGAATKFPKYAQPLWGPRWNPAVVDVLIVPPHHGQIVNGMGLWKRSYVNFDADPLDARVLNGQDPNEASPLTTSYLRAIENSVADWKRAINAYGSAKLKKGLKINVFVVGRDASKAGYDKATSDPEVVITADENKAFILGIAWDFPRVCVVDNSMFMIESMTYEDLFNVNAQEYGHCLGLGHVDEAPNQSNVAALRADAMNGTYAHDPGTRGNPLNCISNLNIRGLEEVYRESLFTGTGTSLPRLTKPYVRPKSTSACHR